MSIRDFRVGDPEIPGRGILLGGGGGIAGSFKDIVVHDDGSLIILQYDVQEGSGRIPAQRSAIKALTNNEEIGCNLNSQLTHLESSGFWKLQLPPFPDSTLRYLVANDKDHGLHWVEWAWPGDSVRLPKEFDEMYNSFRSIIFQKLMEQF